MGGLKRSGKERNVQVIETAFMPDHLLVEADPQPGIHRLLSLLRADELFARASPAVTTGNQLRAQRGSVMPKQREQQDYG